ncbi:(+)-neomenthol dehydrogenase [Tripterygium wilfordii]|uniref:(+)-neomenthol dehydrogenase n=1 Tax=Tripterygium wilfordii TaxID=458696 RepID=A0A7J7CJR1_TRIWF|nr:(+)-neomenthol dehydrogenase-like [Tripterygium wilfordii]KAF5734300.1 (+)-neomenthol dehydrogenase [Tripterygium wilfordii]
MAESTKRYAVVTGSYRGVGLGIVKLLASEEITVVLTSRDEKRGLETMEKLKEEYSTLSQNIVFHQLDVTDPASIASLADFIKSKFGKLDILVNNAFCSGGKVIGNPIPDPNTLPDAWYIDSSKIIETHELAEECIETNYYGAKRMVEALIPLLRLSDSPRIVNVSSIGGQLQYMTNKWALEIFRDIENLTEERVEDVLREFLKDFENGVIEINGWPVRPSAAKISKAALNAYTRILANNYPTNFCINCVCPGPVKTDRSLHPVNRTIEEGAQGPVKLALLPNGGPSGLFFTEKGLSTF